MKTTKYEIIETPIVINITEVRLLTKEEAEALPERLKAHNCWWWTKSAYADRYNFVWGVYGPSGSLSKYCVGYKDAIRPALVFESDIVKIGDMFSFGDKEFEVIQEGLAFCMNDIGGCVFREDWKAEDANDYEKSDIKKYVENWFKENMK